jgi:hypothetical protein
MWLTLRAEHEFKVGSAIRKMHDSVKYALHTFCFTHDLTANGDAVVQTKN